MSTDDRPDFSDLSRAAKRVSPDVSALDPEALPAAPLDLFFDWFADAVEAGVAQPQAMILSSVDHEGGAEARTVLLKDVDEAFWFASSSLSPKGRQMRENPRVALTLFWSERGRQIRIRGDVSPGPREVSAADFTHRHPASRAAAIAFTQSSPIDDPAAVGPAVEEARRRIDADDAFVPDDWTAYRVTPVSVEFWQATNGRDQVRVRYDRESPTSWSTTSLWP